MRGRKVELTRELVELHARLRSEGVPIAEGCRIAGHGVGVYYRWKREGEEWMLLERMNELGLFDESTYAPEVPGAVQSAVRTVSR